MTFSKFAAIIGFIFFKANLNLSENDERMDTKNLVRFSSFTISLGTLFLLSSPVSAQYCRRGETMTQREALVVSVRARGGCGWTDGDCSGFHDRKEETYNAPDGWAVVKYQKRTLDSIRIQWTSASNTLIRGGQQYASSRNSNSNSSSNMSGSVNAGVNGSGSGSYNQSSSSSDNQSTRNASLVTGITLRVEAKAEKAFGGGPGSARTEAVDVLLRCVN